MIKSIKIGNTRENDNAVQKNSQPFFSRRRFGGALALAAVSLSLGLSEANAVVINTETTGEGIYMDNGFFATTWRRLKDSASWATMTANSSSNFKFQWSVTGYGFLDSMRLAKINKPLTSLNINATATYNAAMSNLSTGSFGAYTGMDGWMWSNGIAGRTVEWYIIENWFGSYPNPGGWKGRIYNLNGSNYDVYKTIGNDGQDQWWSIRANRRSSGTINYVQHFAKWKEINGNNPISYQLGNAAFFVETQWGGPSKGTIQYTGTTIQWP